MLNFYRLCLLLALTISCAKEENFSALNLGIAGPIDVATSSDGKYFYVLNTDYDRTYNEGSILVIDEDGKKISAIATPRLGRSLTLAGTDLIATFDRADDNGYFAVHLYDLSKDPTKPELAASWSSKDENLKLDCVPINAVMREGYQHFAVTCYGGRIFLGTLNTPRTSSTLKLVREYQEGSRGVDRTKRALHLDPQRELLFAFPTDYSTQEATDRIAEDKRSYFNDKPAEDVPNEVPDDYEDTSQRRKQFGPLRSRYQFLVYDIAKEREAGFPVRFLDNKDDSVVVNEHRWIYFTLRDGDQTPDTDVQISNKDQKHYRTNFWQARPHPSNNNVFFLSHRGKKSANARFANNIIQVTVSEKIKNVAPVTPTQDALKFERVYGFSGQLDPVNHFPGDFIVQPVNGQLALVVNHFKDLVNFRKNASFAIAAAMLDSNSTPSGANWFAETKSSSQALSFYQVAMNQRGKILSCSFYSNAVIPLELRPWTAINLGWDEKITRIE